MDEETGGTFCQWYEVYREEGYESEQAESMADRSARSNQPLPDWYINLSPNIAKEPLNDIF